MPPRTTRYKSEKAPTTNLYKSIDIYNIYKKLIILPLSNLKTMALKIINKIKK